MVEQQPKADFNPSAFGIISEARFPIVLVRCRRLRNDGRVTINMAGLYDETSGSPQEQ
jgi:hypothetical protein